MHADSGTNKILKIEEKNNYEQNESKLERQTCSIGQID